MTQAQRTPKSLGAWIAVLALAVLPSCVLGRRTTNQALQADRMAQLEPGVSTASDVVQALGAPMDVVQLGRRSAYRYDYSVDKASSLFLVIVTFANLDTQADRAWFFFDENDVLTHAGSTFESEDAEFTMPWSDRD